MLVYWSNVLLLGGDSGFASVRFGLRLPTDWLKKKLVGLAITAHKESVFPHGPRERQMPGS